VSGQEDQGFVDFRVVEVSEGVAVGLLDVHQSELCSIHLQRGIIGAALFFL